MKNTNETWMKQRSFRRLVRNSMKKDGSSTPINIETAMSARNARFARIGNGIVNESFVDNSEYLIEKNIKTNDSKIKGIISLTTWKKRIKKVITTINSILNNTKDFKVVLVLSEEEFPKKEKEIPSELLSILSSRFEILWVYKNYKAFKKVLFTMEKYPQFPVISMDDDMTCINDYFTIMYNAWLKNKTSFITSKSHNFKEVMLPVSSNIRHSAGCCTLYPPYCFGDYGTKCLSEEILNEYESDSYYSALKYYLNLTNTITLPEIEKMYKFNDTDKISPMREKYLNNKRRERRKKIFEYTRRNINNLILDKTTILTANYNSSELTRAMILSLRKQLGFNIHVTIIDNSTQNKWNNSINDNVEVIDNTNFRIIHDYKQASLNHGYSIDYALKKIDFEWVVLCDCDILYKPALKNILNFTPRDFDICGEIGHDVMPKDRLFPYFCIINNKKIKHYDINFFDEQTDLKKGYDTGYSLLVNSQKNKLKIKNININDYVTHLKGGVLHNKNKNKWLNENKNLWMTTK